MSQKECRGNWLLIDTDDIDIDTDIDMFPCIAHPVRDTSCLAVHTVCPVR